MKLDVVCTTPPEGPFRVDLKDHELASVLGPIHDQTFNSVDDLELALTEIDVNSICYLIGSSKHGYSVAREDSSLPREESYFSRGSLVLIR